VFRLARRVTSLLVLVVVGYAAVTFGQVWLASRRDNAGPAQAIVVLGAAQYNGTPSPVLRARLDHAADLYAQHVAPTIVVTGGQTVTDPTSNTEASASANYLAIKHQVPQRVILRENAGCNTWESLASTANELHKRGKETVVLVSDPFHSARVAAIARELHLQARVSPTRTSPIGGAAELRFMAKETAVIAAGRVVGFRRLMGINGIARPSHDCH
jgi:uncharacterized SAM-binding protein YcdF (DUF218 family)